MMLLIIAFEVHDILFQTFINKFCMKTLTNCALVSFGLTIITYVYGPCIIASMVRIKLVLLKDFIS